MMKESRIDRIRRLVIEILDGRDEIKYVILPDQPGHWRVCLEKKEEDLVVVATDEHSDEDIKEQIRAQLE